MDVSYCTLPAVVILGVIGGIPLTYVCLPYLKKACKHVFTDRPMSLGPLVSIALLAFLVFSGKAVVGNVRLVSW